MASWLDELDGSISLIIRNYQRLEKISQNHELLKFVSGVNARGFNLAGGETRDEFYKRFPGNGHNSVALAKYAIALEQVAKGLEGHL